MAVSFYPDYDFARDVTTYSSGVIVCILEVKFLQNYFAILHFSHTVALCGFLVNYYLSDQYAIVLVINYF